MEPKTIFKSRTAVLALITALIGALGTACEPVKEFLKSNADLILIGLGLLNLALRRLTHGRVVILPLDADEPPKL